MGRAGDGVLFESGWYPLEHYKGQTFMWSKNDGEVTACADPNNRTLALLIEPGPGVGSKPLNLTISGNRGDRASLTLKGRGFAKVTIGDSYPAETFVYHAQTHNLPSPNGDKRILNFRALDAVVGSSLNDCKSDIVRDGTLALGKGWYAYETYNGQTFRWVNNNAEVVLPSARKAPFSFEMEVEPGPSLAHAPLVLTVHSSNGKAVATSSPITMRTFVSMAVPAQAQGAKLTLTTKSKDVAVPKDPRKLNFRVFNLYIKP